jgi:hypothetical protein
VKTVRIWLPILAAIAIAAPLSAAEINALEPQWHNAAEVETSTVNRSRIATDAQEVAQGVAQNATQQTPASGAEDASSTSRTPAAQELGSQQAGQGHHKEAEEQIKEQEHQRVLGILPSFNVVYRSDAVSLTGGQKMRLAFRSSIDPMTFAAAFLVAGYHEAKNDLNFGWGVKGYAQRTGAAYLDTFDSNMIGNGILPALLHQDPRYFRLGHGSKSRRLLYAAAAAFICKHDNTGKWEPNYSNVLGNVAAGAISNLYYPGSDSGAGLTISNGMIVTAEGAFGAMFQEFWPDISRKLFHKDPTNGRDAQSNMTSGIKANTP